MKNILERFDKKTPHYPNIYRESILDRFSRKGGGSEEEKFSQGKFFSNYYECYLYATIIGMRKNYRIPFDRANEGTKFIEVEFWKPRQLTLQVFMGLLTLSEIELIDLESLNEDQTDDKAFDLMRLMEEYAHGGFDLIKSKLDENPHFFESSPFSGINFLREV